MRPNFLRFIAAAAASLLALVLPLPTLAQVYTEVQPVQDAARAPGGSPATAGGMGGGVIRLMQPVREAAVLPGATVMPPQAPAAPSRPSEFELYLKLPRFGADMARDAAGADTSPVVPPEYIIQAGDEVLLQLWGSVDADLSLLVDRNGRIVVPRVGAIAVAGTRYGELQQLLQQRISTVFRNFNLSVAMGRLRGIRVLVTGFVDRPGAYVLPALSTATSAIMRAGGPAAAGSFRDIQVRRRGAAPRPIDLYDLLLSGDQRGDQLLQPDDVIHVGPVGLQVAAVGSVNREAIFELRPNETFSDLLRMAGGFNSVADRSRVTIERLRDRQTTRLIELPTESLARTSVEPGDVLRAFSAVGLTLASSAQNKRVRVEGEVLKPGEYILPSNSTLQDAIAAAGGLSPLAYVYATEFSRESVRANQQANYDRALRDLETDLIRQNNSQRATSAEEVNARTAQASGTNRLLERLRAIRPTGRIVLDLDVNATELPPMVLEDGDRISVPAKFTTVGVFGSVFNSGSFLYMPGRMVSDYMKLAGGMTRTADGKSAFLVRPNGTVVSAQQRQGNSWFSSADSLSSIRVEPGDTVFVPAEVDTTTLTQNLKDWTQILYQFGLGIAGIRSLGL